MKKIIINGKKVVDEKYTLALNRKAYVIYYPINIYDDELVISIDDSPILHKYNIFPNGISVIDGSDITKDFVEAKDILESGIKHFVYNNWLKILKENLIIIVGSIIPTGFLLGYSSQKYFLAFIFSLLIIPLLLPFFVMDEWFSYKNIIKKFHSCFRTKIIFKED